MSFAVDANVLLFASDAGSPSHRPALEFLERCAAEDEVFCLVWSTLDGR